MKLRIWGVAALATCLLAAQATAAHAEDENGKRVKGDSRAPMEDLGPVMDDSGLESYGSYDCCPTDYGYSGMGGMGGMGGLLNRPMQFVAGAEYLYAQATFSDALAYVQRDPVAGGETFHQLDFDYESSYSVYGGLYFCDCGGAVIFDYTRLQSSADFAVTSTPDIFVPFEVVGPNNGPIRGGASVEVDSYDLSFAKTIPLGCLQSGPACGDCCDPCCNWCPAWDITWSGGIRYAEVGWTNGAAGFNGATGQFDNGFATTLDFEGIGGRVGLMGRRYIGKRGLASVYARGDWSVLFGDCEIETIISDVNAGPIAFARKSNDLTVPVTEIELGATAHMGAHASFSAGWFWSAWHDLGMSPTYDFETAGANTFQTASFDDANILGWTGFFARAEVAF